jgi:WD40 repeat protein
VADVFVSYAREDQAIVRDVVSALEARKKSSFVDWAGIEPSDHWRDSIREAIEESDAVVCILSPDFLASEICATEREYAELLNKRIIPVLAREVDPDQVPPSLVEPNWILLDEERLEQAVDDLVRALDTDLALVRLHTRLLSRAIAWDAAGRKRTSLLRGQDLKRAEAWLARAAAGARPQPTELQVSFIEASRRGAAQRQRLAIGGALAVAGVAAALSVFALVSRAQAVHESHVAFSRELAADPTAQLAHDPQLALLLGVEALKRSPTPASEAAVVAALDASFVTRIIRVGVPVLDAAFSPDGQLAAVGAADGTVRVWNPVTGGGRQTLHAGRAAVTALAFHPSGTVLVTGSADGRVVVWVRNGNGWRIEGHRYRLDALPISSLAFSPAGTVLAVGSVDKTVRLIPSSQTIRTIREHGPVTSIAFGPDGSTLAVADSKDGATVWNLAVNPPRTAAPPFNPGFPAQVPKHVAVDPSGTNQIAMGSDDGDIRLWSYAAAIPAVDKLGGHVGPVDDVAFSRDGQLLASAGADGTARIWDMNSQQSIRILSGHRQAVTAVALSPDGKILLTSSRDGTAREWRVSGNSGASRAALTPQFELSPHLTGIAVSPHGLLVAASVAGDVHAWPLANPTRGERWTCSYPGCVDSRSSGGAVVAGGPFVLEPGKPTRVLRASDGRLVRRLPGAIGAGLSSNALESVLLTGPRSIELRQHDFSGSPRTLPVPSGVRLAAVALTADGGTLAAAADSGRVVVWRRSQGWQPRVLRGAAGDLRAIAFTPDGRAVVAGGSDGNAWMWRLTGGAPRTFAGTSPITSVAVSPNGKILGTGSVDLTARLWDISSGDTVATLTGHNDSVTGIVFLPGGNEVATTGADGTVRLWDACLDCLSPRLLLARARRATVRCLTALERRVYLHEHVSKDQPCAA